MIETKSIDLDLPLKQVGDVIHFTRSDDRCWAGIIDLPAWGKLSILPDQRNEFYVLKGSLINHTGPSYTNGTFLGLTGDALFSSGAEGARLFAYRDSKPSSATPCIVMPDKLKWHEGGVPSMQATTLHHTVTDLLLVSWVRGTQMHFHDHPLGEEFFVLMGELCDERGRYKAGTWQRLHPGTGHAPYAETDTLILLRNGHLYSRQ